MAVSILQEQFLIFYRKYQTIFKEKSIKTKENRTLSCAVCVRVTYFHGQSPGNYRRRT